MADEKCQEGKNEKLVNLDDLSVYEFQHVASEPPTAKSLAQLVQQFIQLQEEHLGRKAKNPPFTRLPVSSFFKSLPSLPYLVITIFSRSIYFTILVPMVHYATYWLHCTDLRQIRDGGDLT